MKRYRSHKNKVLQALLLSQPVYVKDTGVLVELDYMGKDINRRGDYGKERVDELETVKIEFLGTPNLETLKLCISFDIIRNSISKKVTGSALIAIENLSLQPFETDAAKVLFEK